MTESRRLYLLARLAGGLAVSWFAFWACAPPSTLAPPVSMADDQHFEVGGTAMGGAYLATVYRYDDTGEVLDPYLEPAPALGVNLWAMGSTDRMDFGGTLSGGGAPYYGGAVAGGGFARFRFVDNGDVVVAAQLSAGWLWASVALPVGVRVSPDIWLYTAPEVGMRFLGPVALPVGVSYGLNERVRIHGELGVHGNIPGLTEIGYLTGPIVYGGVGLTARP